MIPIASIDVAVDQKRIGAWMALQSVLCADCFSIFCFLDFLATGAVCHCDSRVFSTPMTPPLRSSQMLQCPTSDVS